MVSDPGIPPTGEGPSRESEGVAARGGAREGAAHPLSAILEASPDAALIASPDGTVLAVNEAFAETWGEEAAGRAAGERLDSLLASGGRELLEGVAARGSFSGAGRAVRGDGAEVELRLSARLLRDTETSDGRLAVFAADVTGARRLERAAAVLGTTLDGPGAEGFFDRLAAGLSETLRMEMTLVGRLEEGEPPRVRTIAFRTDGAPGTPFTYELAGAPCEQVVGREPCVYPSRVAERFPRDAVLAARGLSSYVGVPLVATDGRPLGLLAALSVRPLHDGVSACRALGLFAARAAGEIERTDALREREARLERINRLLRTASRVRELLAAKGHSGGLAGRVCDALVEDGLLAFAWVGLLDETGTEVRLAGASKACDPELYRIDLRTLAGGMACGRAAFLTGTAVLVGPGSGQSVCSSCAVLGDHPYRTGYATPLWGEDRALGVLVVHAPSAEVFHAEECRILSDLADSVAAVLERPEPAA